MKRVFLVRILLIISIIIISFGIINIVLNEIYTNRLDEEYNILEEETEDAKKYGEADDKDIIENSKEEEKAEEYKNDYTLNINLDNKNAYEIVNILYSNGIIRNRNDKRFILEIIETSELKKGSKNFNKKMTLEEILNNLINE